MTRLSIVLAVCLTILSGCSFALEKKQWFEAADPAHTRSRVTLTALGRPHSTCPPYGYTPLVQFHDSDGTTWQVSACSKNPKNWRVFRVEPAGQLVEIPLVEKPAGQATAGVRRILS